MPPSPLVCSTCRRGAMARAASSEAAAACTPELVLLAHTLADVAAGVTSRYFRTPVPVDVKSDARWAGG